MYRLLQQLKRTGSENALSMLVEPLLPHRRMKERAGQEEVASS